TSCQTSENPAHGPATAHRTISATAMPKAIGDPVARATAVAKWSNMRAAEDCGRACSGFGWVWRTARVGRARSGFLLWVRCFMAAPGLANTLAYAWLHRLPDQAPTARAASSAEIPNPWYLRPRSIVAWKKPALLPQS